MFPGRRLRGATTVLAAALLVAAASCAPKLPASGTVDVQLLAFNDFHGALEPPAGSNGRVGQTAAGGVEYMATVLHTLAQSNANTLMVSAGDNIGASPLLSGMFHDEPTIEALSDAGLQLSAVGNHELDEGWDELYRMQKGGCHPVDGCQDNTPFAGAKFQYLSSNLLVDPSTADPARLQRSGWHGAEPGSAPQPLFPPYAIRQFNGVRIGFIGLTLRGVGSIVSAGAMKGLVVTREADAANDVARTLHAQGVNAIVVLIHEGGWQQTESGQDDANACADFSGPIIDIAKEMSPDVDVIISGHTHRAYVCTIASKLVTSAASFSRLVTDIDLHLDRASGRVTSKSARNIVVTRDVGRDGRETAVLDHYRPFAAVVAGKPVGTAASTIPNMRNIAGESALGDLIADGMLDGARGVAGGAQVALQNIGGIRSDLVRSEPSGTITYNDVFNVLPFGNVVIVKTLTGDALVRMLEQQTLTRVLQVSGITYAWDPTRPAGSRIERASIRIDGKPMVPTERYRVASNDFVWNGGDDFTVATEGTDPIAVGTDVDVFVTFLGTHSPVRPGPQDRIRLYH